jgi:hypothetical protein
MKREIQKEVENFKNLHDLHGRAKHTYLKSAHDIRDFEYVYLRFKKKKITALYIKLGAAASAAAIILGIIIWNNKEKNILEDHYYMKQTEWIALSDEALLTIEYINTLKSTNNYQHTENDWLWNELE